MTKLWRAVVALLALALGMATPAAAAWRQAESPNFILYSEASEERIREQAALLEDYQAFLRLLTGVDDPPAPNKLRVYLARDRGQLNMVRDMPAATRGFYTASSSGLAAFVDDRGGRFGVTDDEILFHEIAHHFMLQYRPMAYPPWFVEGFAEYVMTAKLRPGTIEFGQPSANRAMLLNREPWLPIEKILFERPPRNTRERALFYAQSWLLTHYLMRDDLRRIQFKAFMAATAAGTPARPAFAAQFGDLKAFNKGLETYAARQMTYSRLTRSSAATRPDIRITTLPRSADELLLAEAALYVGQSGDYARAVLAKVRSEAARHPGDAYAKRVLAAAEVLHGDPARGEALLDELLAAAPTDAELIYLKGMRHLIAGRSDAATRKPRFAQARTWFARAHKADGNHWRALARYAESLTTDARFNSENTLNILLIAHELAPQVVELTMNAANLLMLRGRHGEAEALLLPLASHPHNDALAAAAQALLDKVRAGAGAKPKPASPPTGE
jgi:Flp pilus assembly protein TadD